MTREQAVAAAREIDAQFLAPTGCMAAKDERGVPPWHLRWMVEEMVSGMSEGKTMRWLGYIQGVLVAQDRATLSRMKKINQHHAAISSGKLGT